MNDPAALTGLLADLPKTNGAPTILGQYDESGSGRPKVRCAVCHRAVHFKGFLVEVPEVGRALLGNKCGKDHFGFDWEKDVQRFEAAADRQRVLVRLQEAVPFIEPLIDLAPHMLAGAKRVDQFISDLRGTGKFAQLLVKAVRDHGGGLMVTVRERNREAEEEHARRRVGWMVSDVEAATDLVQRQAAQRQLKSWIEQHGQVFVDRLEQRGVLAGGKVLTPSTLAPEVTAATVRLRQARDAMEETVSDPQAVIDALRTVGHAYTRVMASNGDLDVFTAQANVKTVEQWRKQIEGLYGAIPAAGAWAAEGRYLVQSLWNVIGKA